MKVHTLLTNRVSLPQKNMNGGSVSPEHIRMALKAAASVPVHGKGTPFHFEVFAGDSLSTAHDVLYSTRTEKQTRAEYNTVFQGVGAFIYIYCKKDVNKCPFYEDEWATACAVYAISVSLTGMGYGCKWNTVRKESIADSTIKKALGIDSEAYVPMGYLMIGKGDMQEKPRPEVDSFTNWR